MRIAWFSPLPPHRSGIAAYSAELLPRLAAHDIEAFVDDTAGHDAVERVARVDGAAIRGAHDFPWRHARRPFDVVVYHVGNSAAHDYLWPYMVRYPGLVVLHDGQLHQARAQALIRQRRESDFRAEFTWCYPDVSPLLADLVVAGLGATLCYFWPMVHVPVQAARVVAVHSGILARDLAEAFPGSDIRHVHMGVADPLARRVGAGPRGQAPPRHPRRRGGVRLVRPGHAREGPERRACAPWRRSGRRCRPSGSSWSARRPAISTSWRRRANSGWRIG